MTRLEKGFFSVCLGLGLLLGPFIVRAQQQFSGGQAVTVSSGSITATQATGSNLHVAVDSAPTTAVTGTFWQGTQPVSLASIPALVAGTAKIGIAYPYTSCGTTAFTEALQALPTSSTAITTTTTCLTQVTLANTSAGALTVTLSDNQGTPINFLNAVTLNAGETRTYLALGKFTSGIKVQASGVGITYTLEGLQ